MKRNVKHPMNYTLSGLEELGLFPDAASREKALEECAKSARGWDLVVGVLVCMAVAITAYAVGRWIVVRLLAWALPFPLPREVPELLRLAIVVVSVFLALRWVHRWGARKALRESLVINRVPICIQCGYQLRSLPADTEQCPECGRDIDPRVREILASNPTSEGE